MPDIIKNFRAIHHFISGIFANSRGEYTLTFVQDPDNRWYIDMPWDGNRGNLEMVAGADDLLTYLDTEHQHRVTLHVIPSDHRLTEADHPGLTGHCEMTQLDKSLFGGSHYDTSAWPGFRLSRLCICPVTLCVLGCYPKYLYVKKA
ncbi:MAG: DUF6717 family protein [Muribaculaceae bacterium]|nr:DUF6717 family protein [Muribaculaceae bacterium]